MKKRICKFRMPPLQPCGNPVFMRVQRISPAEKLCICAQPGYEVTSASSPTRSLTLGRWGCGEQTIQSLFWQRSSSLISGSIRVTSACRVTSAFRNWSNQARNCTSSGFLTFASNAAPTTTFCAVSRLRLFASGAAIWLQLRQFSVRVFCSFRDSVRGEKSHFSASLVV